MLLELVQNADDCQYEEGVEPSFQLVLFKDSLLVATNELGFTPSNVDAICDLGSSSKSRSLGAFTGEKGEHWEAVGDSRTPAQPTSDMPLSVPMVAWDTLCGLLTHASRPSAAVLQTERQAVQGAACTVLLCPARHWLQGHGHHLRGHLH